MPSPLAQLEPGDPISAATHENPYPYYARLVAERPWCRDPDLGIWVAASAAAVTAVLTHPAGRVRPLTEPVPAALCGSDAGALFGRLVRMRDDPGHRALKAALASALGRLDPAFIASVAARCADNRGQQLRAVRNSERLSEFSRQIPLYVIAVLLGVGEDELPDVVAAAGNLVDGFLPGASPEGIAQGSSAARLLMARFAADHLGTGHENLLVSFSAEAARAGVRPGEAIVANAIGFLTQARDATAGLIGLSLLALARDPELRAGVAQSPDLLSSVIEEVSRFDSPVQNTRRFMAEEAEILGQRVHRNDTVLVLLAAANRDPAANRQPDEFLPHRPSRRLFTFGLGVHACPGQRLATVIAHQAVRWLLDRGVDPSSLDPSPVFRPSANVRIPLLRFLPKPETINSP